MVAPTTAWEDNGGTAWTTLAQEASFLAAVEADSPRVKVHTMCLTSVDQTPVRAVVIGGDAGAPDLTDLADYLLVITSVHGPEPSSREAALILLRDIAYSTDTTLAARLAEMPVVFIPTINPEGRSRNNRFNAQGYNINRTYGFLNSAENQAVAHLMQLNATDPCFIFDGHEWSSATEDIHFKTHEWGAPPQVAAWGDDFYANVIPAIYSGTGVTFGPYPHTAEWGMVTSMFPAIGIPSLLSETRDANADTKQVADHQVILNALYDYCYTNRASLVQVREDSRAWVVENALTNGSLLTNDNVPVKAPRGYLVKMSTAGRLIRWHGLEAFRLYDSFEDVFIPTAQPKGYLLPYLFDTVSGSNHPPESTKQIYLLTYGRRSDLGATRRAVGRTLIPGVRAIYDDEHRLLWA